MNGWFAAGAVIRMQVLRCPENLGYRRLRLDGLVHSAKGYLEVRNWRESLDSMR